MSCAGFSLCYVRDSVSVVCRFSLCDVRALDGVMRGLKPVLCAGFSLCYLQDLVCVRLALDICRNMAVCIVLCVGFSLSCVRGLKGIGKALAGQVPRH